MVKVYSCRGLEFLDHGGERSKEKNIQHAIALLDSGFPSFGISVLESMGNTLQYYILKRNRVVSIISVKRMGRSRAGKYHRNILYNAVTHPDHRGKGYMKRLLREVIDRHPRPSLEVFLDNIPAITLYHRMGFRNMYPIMEEDRPGVLMKFHPSVV